MTTSGGAERSRRSCRGWASLRWVGRCGRGGEAGRDGKEGQSARGGAAEAGRLCVEADGACGGRTG
eukprot:363609-Chlamydomonas_euryale.AAC.15